MRLIDKRATQVIQTAYLIILLDGLPVSLLHHVEWICCLTGWASCFTVISCGMDMLSYWMGFLFHCYIMWDGYVVLLDPWAFYFTAVPQRIGILLFSTSPV